VLDLKITVSSSATWEPIAISWRPHDRNGKSSQSLRVRQDQSIAVYLHQSLENNRLKLHPRQDLTNAEMTADETTSPDFLAVKVLWNAECRIGGAF
jgi:hypothetical protein